MQISKIRFRFECIEDKVGFMCEFVLFYTRDLFLFNTRRLL